ncbi:hypothetical protein L218DRAFT_963322 [Marasmius fiardii PR-910]|nr:hypothetical protein L218DRAFT_963322 [Marasmius fiardii PR-910]
MQYKLVLAALAACLSSAVLASPAVCSRLVTDCQNHCQTDTLSAGCSVQTCLDYCECKYCSGQGCDATCKPEFF